MHIVITHLLCSIKKLYLILRACFALEKVNYDVLTNSSFIFFFILIFKKTSNIFWKAALQYANVTDVNSIAQSLGSLKNRQCKGLLYFYDILKQLTRDHNVVEDGWASPFPHTPIHNMSPKGNMWSAIPVALLCMVVKQNGGSRAWAGWMNG